MLTLDVETKLRDPAIKQAISFWVMQVVNQLGQVQSEKKIKKALFNRFKMLGLPITPVGVEFIYKLAVEQFEAHKKAAQTIVINGN